MKAAVTIAGGRLGLAELDEPTLQPGQVRIAVAFCGICGSDLHWRSHFPEGTVMGHEVVGRVAELGPGVSGWEPGERVVVMPVQPCGTCGPCQSGWPNICADRTYGIGGPRARGGYAQSTVVLTDMLLRLPDQLSDRAAALIEPLAVGLHGVNRAALSRDQRVMVMGAGTIGLVTALVLQARNVARLVVVEPNPARRANLDAVGIAAVDSANAAAAAQDVLGGLPDVIFECAGYPAAVSDAVHMLAPRGTLVVLSAPSAAVPLPQWDLMTREAGIVSAMFYTREEFVEAIDLLTSGAVPPGGVPTTVFALDDAPRALDELVTPGTPHMKVLLQPKEFA